MAVLLFAEGDVQVDLLFALGDPFEQPLGGGHACARRQSYVQCINGWYLIGTRPMWATSPATESPQRNARRLIGTRPMVIERQRRRRERRRLCLGETNRGRLPTFVVTERRGKIRFVTSHPMHPTQREIYRGEKYDGQDQDSQL